MKVEQNNNVFKPITITLETKEEADYLWHLLNTTRPFIEYGRKDEVLKLREDLGRDMFNVFDDVHEVR